MKVYKGVWPHKVTIDGEVVTINREPITLDQVYSVEMTKLSWQNRGWFHIVVRNSIIGGQLEKMSVVYRGGQEATFEELFDILSVAAKKNSEQTNIGRFQNIVSQFKEVSFKSYSTECSGCGAPVNVTKEGEICEYCGKIVS